MRCDVPGEVGDPAYTPFAIGCVTLYGGWWYVLIEITPYIPVRNDKRGAVGGIDY